MKTNFPLIRHTKNLRWEASESGRAGRYYNRTRWHTYVRTTQRLLHVGRELSVHGSMHRWARHAHNYLHSTFGLIVGSTSTSSLGVANELRMLAWTPEDRPMKKTHSQGNHQVEG